MSYYFVVIMKFFTAILKDRLYNTNFVFTIEKTYKNYHAYSSSFKVLILQKDLKSSNFAY